MVVLQSSVTNEDADHACVGDDENNHRPNDKHNLSQDESSNEDTVRRR